MQLNENVWNHTKNQKNYHIAQDIKYFSQFLGTTSVVESKPEALEEPIALMNVLTIFNLKQIWYSFREALEERANRELQELTSQWKLIKENSYGEWTQKINLP